MYESMNYITLHFYGYNLMIKKWDCNKNNKITWQHSKKDYNK
jgi:hypothetical protein